MRFQRMLPALLAPIVITLTSPLTAQTVTGSVSGTVTDSSGAVVPSAQVTAHNVATGVDTQATTNAAGVYSIRFLPIGQYEVTVQASGFSTQKLPAFALEVDQTVKFDAHLKAGGSTTTVDVQGDVAPILNTNDPTLGTTFTANTISNVPLNGLDFSALTLYIPGSVTTYGVAQVSSYERSTYNSDIPNINGNRAQANNYTLDGIDLNETQNNLIAYSPAPAALQEVKILSANAPADYGNVNGGGVVSVLASGTNAFHGSAYGYIQNQKFNANSWQNKNQTPVIAINPFTQSQFGGTFGGPIKRNKLFFFVDYLAARQHSGGTSSASVFTQAMRNGDFSTLLSGANGNTPIQLYDPENNFAPYPNNQLPTSAFTNPVAQYLFAHPDLYPEPNATPTDGIAKNNLQGPLRNYHANNQGDIKIEYDPRPADKITGFYSMGTGYDGSTSVLAIQFPTTSVYPTKLGGANWVHVFSPALINSARVGFTRVVWVQGLPTDPSGQFGLKGNSIVGIPFGTQSYVGYSYQSIGGGISGGGVPAYVGSLTDNTFSYIDNLTWQRGPHLLSMGIQALRYQNAYITNSNTGFLGSLGYTGDFTRNPAASNGNGYGGADFLLNRVQNASVTSKGVLVGQRQWRTAAFVQDDWKVLPNLTLNLGVRYEFDQPWYEQNDKTGNIDIATQQVIYATRVPAGAPAGSGLCSNRACYNANYTQIMPRVGFAYQPTDRLVVRAGYGATSFFEGNNANQRLNSITPFVQSTNVNVTAPTAANTAGGAPNPGGTPRTAQQGFDNGATTFGGSYQVWPQNIQPAYVQEWSLTTEYAVTHTMSLQVGYLGEQGQHIEDYGNLNQWVNGDQTQAPYYNNAALGIGSSRLQITESRAMMNFNALEATLRERVNHGLEFTLNYTYGRAMTNSDGNFGINTNGYGGYGFQNYYDSAADYGPAGYDVRHNVSWTGVYDLPFGRGKEFASNVNRFVDEAIGGWKFSVAGAAYSGFPETVSGPNNNSNSYGVSRANQYRKLKIVHHNINQWFGDDPSATPCLTPGVDNGVCAFGAAASNAFGTSSNGALRGPGYLNVDMSAFKDFHTFREQTFGFRFDAFNALNIVSYGNPDTGITDSTFGQIASQNAIRSSERHLQFSARYSF